MSLPSARRVPTGSTRAPRIFARLAAPLFLPLLLDGCDAGAGGGSGAAAVRDSAGVRIVESPHPRLPPGEGWSVEPEPYLTIGVVDGEEPYLLSGVFGVQLLPDGRVLLANSGDHTVRVYGPDGRYLFRAGRRGEGPGEFTTMGGIFVRDGEITVAHGLGSVFLERFDLNGGLVRSVRPQGILPALPALQVRDLLGDGSAVVTSFPQGGPATPGLVVQDMPIFLLQPDGARADSLPPMPGLRYLDVGMSVMIGQEFTPIGQVAAGADHIYQGWPETHEVRVVDRAGALVRIQRWAGELHPVTREHREAYRTRMATMGTECGGPVPEPLRQQRQTMADGMIFPTHHRAYLRLLVDASGHLWVQRYDPRWAGSPEERAAAVAAPPLWDVFDSEGRWVVALETPADFTISTIGEDHLAGTLRDELGVQRAALFRLRR